MRRLFACAWAIIAAVLLAILLSGPSTTAQDSVPATVAALQTTVAGLSTSVARQATQISDLQTAVAGSPGTPSVTATELPDPQSLEITIRLRAEPEDIASDGLGTECQGAGRFDDLAFVVDIAIYDIDEDLLATANFVESELIHEGVIFHECEMRYEIESIPYQDVYIVAITDRSVLTLDYAELEEMDWELSLIYGV